MSARIARSAAESSLSLLEPDPDPIDIAAVKLCAGWIVLSRDADGARTAGRTPPAPRAREGLAHTKGASPIDPHAAR